MPGFADQLHDAGIASLEAAAPWRLAEAQLLRNEGRRIAALYLVGYAAEMRLTAACYRVYGHGANEAIDRQKRSILESEARSLKLMSSEPHDLQGWGRYLIYLRSQRTARGLSRDLRLTLMSQVDALYDQWRPRLRYKAMTPTAAQLAVAFDAAIWLDQAYSSFWS